MKTITLYYKLLSQKDKKSIVKALRVFKNYNMHKRVSSSKK